MSSSLGPSSPAALSLIAHIIALKVEINIMISSAEEILFLSLKSKAEKSDLIILSFSPLEKTAIAHSSSKAFICGSPPPNSLINAFA